MSFLSSLVGFYGRFEKEFQISSAQVLQEDILQISKDLALNAGYERYEHTFRSSRRVIMRTRYSKRFDDLLTAKWLLFYSGHTINLLRQYPKISKQYVDIVIQSFFQFFHYFDIDRFENAHQVTVYVMRILKNLIKNACDISYKKANVDSNCLQLSLLLDNCNLLPSIDPWEEDEEKKAPFDLDALRKYFKKDKEAKYIIRDIVSNGQKNKAKYNTDAFERIKAYLMENITDEKVLEELEKDKSETV